MKLVEKKRDQILDHIGKVMIVALGIMGSLGAFLDMFELPVNWLVLTGLTVPVSSLFLVTAKLKGRNKTVIRAIVTGMMAVFVVSFRKYLKTGIYLVANGVISKYNFYFGENIDFFQISRTSSLGDEIRHMTVLAGFVMVIYACILVVATWYKLFASIHILLSLCFVMPGLFLGVVPDSLFISLLMIYYMSCFMYQHSKMIHPAKLLVISGLSLLIIASIFVVNPPSKYDAGTKYRKIYIGLNRIGDKFHLDDFSMKHMKNAFKENGVNASGGINGGKLGKIGSVHYTGTTMLKLKARRDQYLYLKGFVGTTYEKTRWDEVSADDAANIRKFYQNYSSKHQVSKEVVSRRMYAPDVERFQNGQRSLKMSYVKATKDYLYVPYFSDLMDSGVTEYFYGFRPQMQYSLLQQNRIRYKYDGITMNQIYDMADLSYEDPEIYDFVCSISLQVPGQVRKVFSSELDLYADYYNYQSADPKRLQYCVEFVRTYLKENMSYTLKPGVLSGDDFVIDFLTKKKKGYCTSFASAGTLMLRYMGVPARYVEGYVVAPSGEGLIEEEFSVTDRSAHAWVEIYVPGLGFAPVEMTPGYDENVSPPVETQSIDETEKPEPETTTEDSSEEKTTTGTEPESTTVSQSETDPGQTVITPEEPQKKEHQGDTAVVLTALLILVIVSLAGCWIFQKNRKVLPQELTPQEELQYWSERLESGFDRIRLSHTENINIEEMEKELQKKADFAIAYLKQKKPDKNGGEKLERLQKIRNLREVLEILYRLKYSGESSVFTGEKVALVRDYVMEFESCVRLLKKPFSIQKK